MEKDKVTDKLKEKSLDNLITYLVKNSKIIIVSVIILIIAFFAWKNFFGAKNQTQYQTSTATRGTLITSVGESGTVAIANRRSITTQASGLVSEVDVKDGDTVTQGQKIAVISLDLDGQQRQAQAWSNYLNAKNSLADANAGLYSQQSTMFAKWQTYLNFATNGTYQNGDGSPNIQNRQAAQFISAQDDWLTAQALYQNQQNVVSQSQSGVNSAWYTYQAASSEIDAPVAGTISDLTIVPGLQITSSSNTGSSNGVASQVVAAIKSEGNPVINVNISEIDAAQIKAGDKATVTFDALPDQTFTGKVLGIDTTGVVSSGVTSYPTIIQLDLPNDKILPNMSATANIITSVKPDVILIPTAAIQTSNSQSIVKILKNGIITDIPVVLGGNSDTDTEIISGINEGDTVITGIASTGTQPSGATSSPFGGGFRGFGGGAVIRPGGGARGG